MRYSRTKGKISKVIFKVIIFSLITMIAVTSFIAYKNEPVTGEILVKKINHPALQKGSM